MILLFLVIACAVAAGMALFNNPKRTIVYAIAAIIVIVTLMAGLATLAGIGLWIDANYSDEAAVIYFLSLVGFVYLLMLRDIIRWLRRRATARRAAQSRRQAPHRPGYNFNAPLPPVPPPPAPATPAPDFWQ
jgi:hypothetical protein